MLLESVRVRVGRVRGAHDTELAVVLPVRVRVRVSVRVTFGR